MAPFKRERQPKMTTQALLDFDLGESSSDSDFRISENESGGSVGSAESSDDENSNDSEEGESDNSTLQLKQILSGENLEAHANGGDDLDVMLKELDNKVEETPKLPTKSICCVCLGDRSDDSNEIIECDGCGVSVHEGCYGVSDNVSISSTNSTCSTEPWFCEACRAGVSDPACELCPNKGGIFKETDVGQWVHLVCALYVPGVAFGEVDQLSSVTLFEMQYSKWGAKACSLCENSQFARTGVCIGCDAGMCKTYFHVTCAQAAGFLTEAHHEEAEAADPFYAHCKIHSEKEMIKKRKRNFHTYRLNMQQNQNDKLRFKMDHSCPGQMRIQRKLLKYQRKYMTQKKLKMEPWVPTQKMSRLLTTSASACKRLLRKAATMSVDVELLERQESQIAALTEIRKKWHIAPAFSVEFVGYYLDRISRSQELKQQLIEMIEANNCLSKEQDTLRKDYDSQLEKNKELKGVQEHVISNINLLHKELMTLCPNKSLPNPMNIGRAHHDPPKPSAQPTRPISVLTAAALKMGCGFPLTNLGPPGTIVDSTRLLSMHVQNSPSPAVENIRIKSAPSTPTPGVHTYECGICKRCTDQHLLAKCDTCQLHYHLGCLNPPLTRHPKKSKLYGWQCSECDKSDDSEAKPETPKGPRKARTRFNKDGSILAVKSEKPLSENFAHKRHSMDTLGNTKLIPNKKKLNETADFAIQHNSEKSLLTPIIKKAKVKLERTDSNKSKKMKSTTPKSQSDKNELLSDEPVLLELSEASTACNTKSVQSSDPLALPSNVNTTFTSLDETVEMNTKVARKQKRKDKHKSKHNLSSDAEKSPNKEHKRKRKKKQHDHDVGNPNDSNASIPKIKIKFKTLPLPGEVTPEAQFFYVSADMVRSAEEGSRPTSVETVEDLNPSVIMEDISVTSNNISTISNTAIHTSTPTSSKITPRKTSPRKLAQKAFNARTKTNFSTKGTTNLNCCVCQKTGLQGNVVTCDECRKQYHFTCLDPPVKKTPKIRGYSWHCADCDPTDEDTKNPRHSLK
ncbi:PHD finger protein 14 [Teleopsis dalmanni]|uniref:PHD finger protein 14 n=1 Tax=Teleopsis dalmanni TaxID=139649 RepID=UPI0018CDD134|nr:PHD finger protein 14 [Teleopsis dalmanni]